MPAPQPVRALRPLPLRRSLPWASLLGYVAIFAVPVRAAENLWLDVAHSSITTTELHGHVSVLADDMLEGREAGMRGGHVAAKYLIQRLEEAGLQPAGTGGQFTQRFPGNLQNILAVIPGSDAELRDEYVLVGAHYDHVGYGSRQNSYGPWGFIHNGADDNASGVAAVLEVIDALAQARHQPRRSIIFAFWDGEEKGLLGSQHWRSNSTIPFDAVRLTINVDMVGRLKDGRIEVGGTRSALGARQVMSSPRLSSDLWLDFDWEFKKNSDHWTFFEAGVPSLYIHTGLHDDYHRPSDDVEKLNVEGIRQVSAYLLERLFHLADIDQLPRFRSGATLENPALRRKLEQPLPELASRLDFTWEYLATQPASVVVRQVPDGSRAQLAGLAAGDRILAVNGHEITSESSLASLALQSDKELELNIARNGEEQSLTVAVSLVGGPTRLGLSWRADPAEPRAVYVTRVVPHSPADLAGIELHDRLYALNSEPFSSADELLNRVKALLDRGDRSLHYRVESRGAIREVVVQLGAPAAPATDATL